MLLTHSLCQKIVQAKTQHRDDTKIFLLEKCQSLSAITLRLLKVSENEKLKSIGISLTLKVSSLYKCIIN